MVSCVLPRFLHYNFGENFVRQAVASVQLQSCPTLCNPMDCNMPCFSVYHQLLQLAQTHVHWVGDAIQPSHSLLSPSPPALSISQHQGLFQWVSSSHQVARVLEFQLQQAEPQINIPNSAPHAKKKKKNGKQGNSRCAVNEGNKDFIKLTH